MISFDHLWELFTFYAVAPFISQICLVYVWLKFRFIFVLVYYFAILLPESFDFVRLQLKKDKEHWWGYGFYLLCPLQPIKKVA